MTFWHKWSIDKIEKMVKELEEPDPDSFQRHLVNEDEYWLFQMHKYLEELYDNFPSF